MSDSHPSTRIEDRIKSFISHNLLYTPDEFAYSDDASFLQEGVIDSLGVMQLVEFVSQEFSISVAQNEVTPANFDSIRKLSRFVEAKRAAAAA